MRGGELQGDFFTGCDFGDGLVAVNTVGETQRSFLIMCAVRGKDAAIVTGEPEVVIRLFDFLHRTVAQYPFLSGAVVAAAAVINIAIGVAVTGKIEGLTQQAGGAETADFAFVYGKKEAVMLVVQTDGAVDEIARPAGGEGGFQQAVEDFVNRGGVILSRLRR